MARNLEIVSGEVQMLPRLCEKHELPEFVERKPSPDVSKPKEDEAVLAGSFDRLGSHYE